MSCTEPITQLEKVTIGGGCFWCIENLFQKLQGIYNIRSGYSGGRADEATYKQVKTGKTGHAEVIHFQFDPKIINFKDIIQIFMNLHDPTTLNKQGIDEGPQYRSVIFYHNEEQKQISEEIIQQMTEDKIYENKIVTEVTEFNEFFLAEEDHQNYYNLNPEDAFCRATIDPKVRKLYKKYYNKLVVAAAN
ncbi:Peptide methionine sulfoxide reductase MsrA [Pseudocohnilembus persalinus]|uniref:peptide-methionine (S)-S-oxide reductase n=1 Tax=Pseudocohnilembus persalinus TaxID=266149 RepID=A0A0V0QMM3_PSEPJ|nr:Peptide methionine sulfoxide reductase MsrA [Pseudocohnilembus persalinus]|eukprot:KRX03583.1 Peptide methionine sulfoxide reductase MsrA [Pseudocohnilembus persalinus]